MLDDENTLPQKGGELAIRAGRTGTSRAVVPVDKPITSPVWLMLAACCLLFSSFNGNAAPRLFLFTLPDPVRFEGPKPEHSPHIWHDYIPVAARAKRMMWYLLVLNVSILVTVSVFSVSAMSHVAISWVMREEFEIAMRSPSLAALSGCAGTFVSFATVLMYVLASEDDDSTAETEGIGIIPTIPTLYTGPYILRGFRLLVMYNPQMRKRWGAIARESSLGRAMLASCVALQVIGWTSTLFFGIERVADQVFVVYVADTLLTIGACIVLYGKLRKTDDIYKMSTELQTVGALALLALGIGISYMFVPSRYTIVVWMMVRFHACIWVTNIQPIRTILRRRAGNTSESGLVSSFFPYVPWKTQSSYKVAIDCGSAVKSFGSSMTPVNSEDAGSVLDMIIHIPPLLEAFKAFCQKALCSESLMFLLDAAAFSALLEEAPADSADSYDRYVNIVDKYVRESSPFEINIESKTRNAILRSTDRKTYVELTLAGKTHMLNPAVKEVGKMLKENLYTKFRATTQYKHIQDQLSALEEVGG